MSTQPNLPAMSVVLVTPDRHVSLRKTIDALRAQMVRDRLELIFVAPLAAKLEFVCALRHVLREIKRTGRKRSYCRAF
jgi:hypothetical protein